MANLSVDLLPGSAMWNCIGNIFQFLNSPVGQLMANDVRTVVVDLINLTHKHAMAADTTQAAA